MRAILFSMLAESHLKVSDDYNCPGGWPHGK